MFKFDSKIVNYSIVKEEQPKVETKSFERPEVLHGATRRITNHYDGYNVYLTVNYHEGNPIEVFIDSSHTDATQWVKALSRMISMNLQSGNTIEDVAKQLCKVHSANGYHTGGKGGFVNGVVEHIGKTLRLFTNAPAVTPEPAPEPTKSSDTMKDCPECGEHSYVLLDGCWTCQSCGHGKCG